jgi:hypothetical protein
MTNLEKKQLEMYLDYFDTDKVDRMLENSSLGFNVVSLIYKQLMKDITKYHGNGKKTLQIKSTVHSITVNAMMVLAQIENDIKQLNK